MTDQTTQQQTDSADTSLGDELFQVDRHTLDSGGVRGQIQSVERADDELLVTVVALTTEETVTVPFDFPQEWTDNHRFVRLVEYCGYSSASVEQLPGSEVPLEQRDGEWGLDFKGITGAHIFDDIEYYYGAFRGFYLTAIIAALVTGWLYGIDVLGYNPSGFEFGDALFFTVSFTVVVAMALVHLYRPADGQKDYWEI